VTWFVLGSLAAVYMRTSFRTVQWWHVAFFSALFLFLRAPTAFPLFLSRYLLIGLLLTAATLRFVPASLSESFGGHEVLHRVGLLRKDRPNKSD
jgi:hypothetical protein